jgi:hypothetical protein
MYPGYETGKFSNKESSNGYNTIGQADIGKKSISSGRGSSGS